MIGLIGRKIGMTQFYNEKGTLCPSTVIEVGPCSVVQVKRKEGKDKYNAVKLGFGQAKKLSKPEKGVFEKNKLPLMRDLHEFRIDNTDEFNVGAVLKADVFKEGEIVMVAGTTKGRGFAGVIKRHKFHGGKDTHGCRSHRVTGSIGSSSDPSRVYPGKKMPGHYGSAQQTTRGLVVVKVDPEKNVIFIKGAVPGANKGIVYITKQG
jgi:large subunit ribosomal protein L3